jgi:hypothetical protein
MPPSLSARIAILVLPLLFATSSARAALVFSHAGCIDPATADPDPTLENWTLADLVAPGAVAAACADAGTDAWEVSDPDAALAGPRYLRDASAAAADAASGWTLRARVRVRDLADAVDGSSVLEASVAGRRFRLLLGSDAVGNTLVRREGESTDVIAQAPAFQETGYHLYELSWDPTAGLAGEADLRIDGLLLSEEWAGTASSDARVLFGAEDVAGTGVARFSDLSFETGVQACRNGLDDDGDGRTDLVPGDTDPGCTSPADPSEKNVLRACDDGLDDDGDGLVDRSDPDCTSVTGRSEYGGFQFVTTGEADWAAAAGGAQPLAFDTTAANVGLASELGSPPAPAAFLCGPPETPVAACQLSFAAASTGLCRDFALRTREAGAGITFDDSHERGGHPAWVDALSIGDIGDHTNDDFEFSFGAGQPVHAFGFHFVDNRRENFEGLKVYAASGEVLGILPGIAAPLSDGNQVAFLGIVSPVPIARVVFDEAADGDDLAIRDFRLGDPDPDADGLGDCAESGLGTDPALADTDADGLADGAEVATHGTLPLDPDSDDDGIPDGSEVTVYGTSPTNSDSDGDGLSDGAEVTLHGTSPTTADSDADGLSDGAEVSTHGTNPNSADSDDDGLGDQAEIETHGTNPNSPDSDGDGLGDYAELYTHGTNPNVADGDGDGLGDGGEIAAGTDPANPDSDGDGLADGPEALTHGTDPLAPDSDSDGLADGAEVLVHLTNPLLADSDGDLFSDGDEVAAGTDPNDPNDFPVATVPSMDALGRLLAAGLVLLLGLRAGARRAVAAS